MYLSARKNYVFVFVFDRVKCTLRVHARAKFHQLKLQEEQLVRESFRSLLLLLRWRAKRGEERRGREEKAGSREVM